MRIIDDEKPKMLTNFEVFQNLRDWQKSDLLNDRSINPNRPNKKKSKKNEIDFNEDTSITEIKSEPLKHSADTKFIINSTIKFLQNTEAIIASDYDNIKKVYSICEKFRLTKAETLQVINNRPKNMQMLYLIIQDISDRMTDDQQEEFIKLIQAAMPIAGIDEP